MLNDWPPWVVLALFLVYFYVAWDMLYYKRLRATGQLPLSALFVLTILMAMALSLFVLVRSLVWLDGPPKS